MRRGTRVGLSALVPFALVVGTITLVGVPAAQAVTTLTVTSPTDAALRSAFTTASATNDDVTIDIEVGAATIPLTAGELVYTGDGLNHALTINGNGATINQTTAGQRVLFDTSQGALTVDHATVSGGQLTDATMPVGGGIEAAGSVTLTSSIVTHNSVDVGVNGNTSVSGGVFTNGDATVVNSAITDNIVDAGDVANSSSFAGGIAAIGSLTITNSTITGNQARGGTVQTLAGGALVANTSPLTATGSTVTDNSVVADGGQALVGGLGSSSNLSVAGSTIAHNSVSGGTLTLAGGIGAAGQVTVTNSTVTANQATGSGRGRGRCPGGRERARVERAHPHLRRHPRQRRTDRRQRRGHERAEPELHERGLPGARLRVERERRPRRRNCGRS